MVADVCIFSTSFSPWPKVRLTKIRVNKRLKLFVNIHPTVRGSRGGKWFVQ